MNLNIQAVPKRKRIQVLNDNFRATLLGGRVMVTRGIMTLPIDTRCRIMLAVQQFRDFDEGNDPHGEHDFGSLNVEGYEIMFKIDYFDRDIRYAADDPSDPAHTTRVMTIFLAEEY